MKKNKKIILICEMALFVAIGIVLDLLQGLIGSFWPSGGSIGIAIIATLIFSYRHGLYGLVCGLITGLLTMLNGIHISPFATNSFHIFLQLGLDYFLSWMVVGFAGLFARKVATSKYRIYFVIGSSILGGFLKFICHFLSGMIYWPSEDTTSQFIYSITYNGSYMLPTIIISTIIMVLIAYKAPIIIKNDKYSN